MKIISVTIAMLCSALTAACSPELDMQGNDPRDYYAQHPIKNQVETRSVAQQVRFDRGESRLSNREVLRLKQALRDVSSMAADGVQVQLSSSDYRNPVRKKHLTALLRSMGYDVDKISFEPSSVLPLDEVRVDVQYAAVIAPDCPDWRRSPVTTYSNTTQGNFRCATEVNLGAMVADPHDLVRGPGSIPTDTQRTSRVVQLYHSGQAASSTTSSASSSESSSGDTGLTDTGLLPDGGGQ